MNLVERYVLNIIEENKTEFNSVIMYEMKMLVDDYGTRHVVDVVLSEREYNMIQEKGYYYC